MEPRAEAEAETALRTGTRTRTRALKEGEVLAVGHPHRAGGQRQARGHPGVSANLFRPR